MDTPKEITLKEWSAYLPYSLKVKDEETTEVFEVAGINPDGILIHDNIDGSVEEYSSTILKPILRDLSDLTKEIEHNGEKFVPIKRITKEYYDKDNETIFDDENKYKIISNKYCYPSNGTKTSHWWLQYKPSIISFDSQDNESCLMQYQLLQKLFEWHFNVFQIPDELIVRVTEDFNPYK